jgi:hypothetical protein
MIFCLSALSSIIVVGFAALCSSSIPLRASRRRRLISRIRGSVVIDHRADSE